jgi:hypothetical protein
MRYRVAHRQAAARSGLTQVLAAMKISHFSLIALSLMLINKPALSCTITITEPNKLLRISSVAALAYPISTSTKPENALSPDFTGEFEQTIQWQVLVSWKGQYQPGDVLTTTGTYLADRSNCGTNALHRPETTLIFLAKKQPLKNPGIFPPQVLIEHLKYLQRIKYGG